MEVKNEFDEKIVNEALNRVIKNYKVPAFEVKRVVDKHNKYGDKAKYHFVSKKEHICYFALLTEIRKLIIEEFKKTTESTKTTSKKTTSKKTTSTKKKSTKVAKTSE